MTQTVVISELYDQIVDRIVTYEESNPKIKDHDYGIVIYCDGGCMQNGKSEVGNHGPGGSGVHGYVYDSVLGKVISGTPSGQTVTDVGYYASSILSKRPGGDEDPFWVKLKTRGSAKGVTNWRKSTGEGDYTLRRVQPIGYFDMYDHLPKPTTNNRAELNAFNLGLQLVCMLVKNGKIKRAHFRSDSDYTIKSYISYLDVWAKNQWKKATGDVINPDLWKIAHECQSLLTNYPDALVTYEWIKGHSDYYGNIIVDRSATKARIASQITRPVVRFKDNLSYFKVTHKPNKIIHVPRWYYLTGEDDKYKENKRIFYVGRHGKDNNDAEFGSRMTDLMYGVVIADDDPVLSQIRDEFDKIDSRFNEEQVFIANFDVIFSSGVYDELYESGLAFVEEVNKDLSLYNDKIIAIRKYPVSASFVAFDYLLSLRLLLTKHLEGTLEDSYLLTDITDSIYGNKTVTKKGEDTLSRITLPEDSPTISVMARHRYNQDVKVQSHKVLLTRGVDLPRRGLFLGIMDDNPKVQLLTWHESPTSFRYAVICSTDKGDHAIWLGPYSNLRFLSNKDRKEKKS